MKDKSPAHKLGANRKELAQKRRKVVKNFSQSRDVREDRCARQEKFSPPPPPATISRMALPKPDKQRSTLLLTEHSAIKNHRVVVNLSHPGAKKVTIAGTFNDWHPHSLVLRNVQPGEWTAELFLDQGMYEYRFLVDDQWVDDPDSDRFVPNGLGGHNSILEVPQSAVQASKPTNSDTINVF